MIKISGGVYKHTSLHTPKTAHIRPTPAVMRVAVMNICRPHLQTQLQPVVWDLFAGCGVMGIEFASQGARQVLFCDNNPRSLELIRRNVELIQAKNLPRDSQVCEFSLHTNDAFQLNRLACNLQPPQIIFADPPFHQTLQWLAYFVQTIRTADLEIHNQLLLLIKLASAELQPATAIINRTQWPLKIYRYGSTALLSCQLI